MVFTSTDSKLDSVMCKHNVMVVIRGIQDWRCGRFEGSFRWPFRLFFDVINLQPFRQIFEMSKPAKCRQATACQRDLNCRLDN